MNPRLRWRLGLALSDLPASAKLVGFIIDTYTNLDGIAWPSRGSIAARANLSLRTVDKALARLEADELLSTVHKSKGRTSNRYLLVLPDDANLAVAALLNGNNGATDTPLDEGDPPNSATAAPLQRNDCTVTVQSTTPNPATVAHELSKKASFKPSTNTQAAAETENHDDGNHGPRALPPEAHELLEKLQRGAVRNMP